MTADFQAQHASGWVAMIGPAEFRAVGDIGLSAWPILQALRWYARDKASCHPSVKTIAELLGLPERTVHHHLAHLVCGGWVTREVHRGRPTVYHLLGTATSCTPPEQGTATSCGEPLQHLADTSATSCGEPLQHLADKEALKKSTQEKHSLKNNRGQAAEIPEGLKTEGFAAAWQEWLAYRRSIRKALKPATCFKQLALLATWGEGAAIEAIETSIRNGWQGLFQPKQNGVLRDGHAHIGPGQRHDPTAADRDHAF